VASSKSRSHGRKAKPAAVKPGAKAKVTAAAPEAKQAIKPDKAQTEQPDATRAPIALVHETDMPDADDFADETGMDGTDDADAARVSALRAILIEGLDAQRIEWRIKRQWPRLKDTAAAIVESAQRTAAKWTPGATRTIGGMQKRITSVDLINERFVMVTVPGQASCIAQISDALFLTRDDFSARLGDSVIVTGVDNKGAVQTKDAAKVWFGDCRRRAASKIVFTSRNVDPDCFNLWTGFGVTPKAGRCDLIHQHIREVICAGNSVAYEALLNLLAWQKQNIGRASRIIVTLYSKEHQVGKGVLLEKILPVIFGLHGIFSASSEQVFGRFNDLIRGKSYCGLDEACFAGDRKTADKIKSYAAAETASIEGKGLPTVQCPVGVNMYLATNQEHAAHVEWSDARYWILKVSPHRKNDRDYWAALFKEIDNGGIAALLHDVLARDVSSFVPQRDVPFQNAEHRANQRASDPANPALWLLDCLDNGLWLGSEKWEGMYSPDCLAKESKGALPISHDASGAKMLPAFLEGSYKAWAVAQGRHVQAAAKDEFWKQLTDFGFATRKTNGKRYRSVPDEEDMRSKIGDRLGFDDRNGRDSEFQLHPKMAGNDTATSISLRFLGESDNSLSLTVPKAESVEKSATYKGSVTRTVTGSVRDGDRDGEALTDPATVPAGRHPSSAYQANARNTLNGSSLNGANGKAPRGTRVQGTHDAGPLSATNVHAARAAETGKRDVLKVAI
jgi:hypothetical protein